MSYSEAKTAGSETCPGCGSALAVHRLGAVQAARCPSCGGLSIARLDLGRAAGGMAWLDAKHRTHSVRNCGRCRRGMREGRIEEVVIDLCTPCGRVFFDAGELEHLKQALQRRRAAYAAAATASRVRSRPRNGTQSDGWGEAAEWSWDLADVVGGFFELLGGIDL